MCIYAEYVQYGSIYMTINVIYGTCDNLLSKYCIYTVITGNTMLVL